MACFRTENLNLDLSNRKQDSYPADGDVRLVNALTTWGTRRTSDTSDSFDRIPHDTRFKSLLQKSGSLYFIPQRNSRGIVHLVRIWEREREKNYGVENKIIVINISVTDDYNRVVCVIPTMHSW